MHVFYYICAYFIMRSIYLIVVLILLSSCTKVRWDKTQDGYYFYSSTRENYEYSWSGASFDSVIHGPGVLIVKNRRGDTVSKTKFTAMYGSVDKDYFQESQMGKYIGEGKIKNGLIRPKEFGVLIVEQPNDEKSALRAIYHNLCGDSSKNHTLIYIGHFKKGKFSGDGNYYIDDTLAYQGQWKKGYRDGFGRQYKSGYLIYEGYFDKGMYDEVGKEYTVIDDSICLKYNGEWKDGKYDGYGKLYNDSILIYDGEWRNGLYDGYGILYNENILVYDGEWKSGLYDGKGKLYSKGQCVDGKWKEGHSLKIYERSFIDEVAAYFGKDIYEPVKYSDLQLAENDTEFIKELDKEIHSIIETELSERVEKRFGFWNLFRMYWDYLFIPDIKRIKHSEDFFCRNLQPEDLLKEINAKIDYYNSTHEESKMSYLTSLAPIPTLSIVDMDLAPTILEREALEVVDLFIGFLVDILVCVILVFVLSLIIKNFVIPTWIFSIISILIALFISIFYGTPEMSQLEMEIKQALINNYQFYLDSQFYIQQIIGV